MHKTSRFKHKDLVWARTGESFWPGRIASDTVTERLLEEKNVDGIGVLLFGYTLAYKLVAEDDLLEYEENYERMASENTSAEFLSAVRMAREEVADPELHVMPRKRRTSIMNLLREDARKRRLSLFGEENSRSSAGVSFSESQGEKEPGVVEGVGAEAASTRLTGTRNDAAEAAKSNTADASNPVDLLEPESWPGSVIHETANESVLEPSTAKITESKMSMGTLTGDKESREEGIPREKTRGKKASTLLVPQSATAEEGIDVSKPARIIYTREAVLAGRPEAENVFLSRAEEALPSGHEASEGTDISEPESAAEDSLSSLSNAHDDPAKRDSDT
jgi:hypothetical protein